MLDNTQRLPFMDAGAGWGQTAMTEPENLQATFKRLEIQDLSRNLCQTKTEQQKEDLGICGHAKKDVSLVIGRLCGLMDRLYCENWNKPELVSVCPTFKTYKRILEILEKESKKV
jgi:hypothetical protein